MEELENHGLVLEVVEEEVGLHKYHLLQYGLYLQDVVVLVV